MSTRRQTEPSVPLALLCLVVAFLVACSDAPPTGIDAPPEGASLDVLERPAPDSHDYFNELLRQRLIQLSGGAGLSFLRLPDEDDLASIPQDPQNPLTPAKVALGKLLFHETGLGMSSFLPEGQQTYSCASCHSAQAGFYSGLPQAIAEGGSGYGTAGEGRVLLPEYDSDPVRPDVQQLRTPTTLNVAYQEVTLWDGRLGAVGVNVGTESQWSPNDGSSHNDKGWHGPETQAFLGVGGHRMGGFATGPVATDPTYLAMFAAVFPSNPVVDKTNIALAMAAYERTVLATEAPFQRWLRGEKMAMTKRQVKGALLFFGKARCFDCHNDPALGSQTFAAVGMNDLDGAVDPRVDLRPFFGETIADRFRKGRGGFTGVAEEEYAFKVPQLYNLTDSNFFGHGSSFASVRDVVEYFNAAAPQNAAVPTASLHPGFQPLGLSAAEVNQLTEFVADALYDPNLVRYEPASLPTGLCFPCNDPQAQIDLGCTTTILSRNFPGIRDAR